MIKQQLREWWEKNGRLAQFPAENLYREEKPLDNIPREEFRAYIREFRQEEPVLRSAKSFIDKLEEIQKTIDELNPEYRKPKVLYFDIETTDFSGGFGVMLMFAYCWHYEGGKSDVKIITLLDNPRWRTLSPDRCDFFLIQELAKLINEADITVGHFASKFDAPFLQTRLAVHNLHISSTKWKTVFDTCITAKKKFKFWGSFCNNKLKSIAKAFGVDDQKDELPLTVWQHSKCIGYEPYFSKAILDMAEYCKQDVRTLYDIAQRMWQAATHLPSYQAITGKPGVYCPIPVCGSENYKEIGTNACKVSAYKEYQCQDCGHIFRSTIDKRKFKNNEKVMY